MRRVLGGVLGGGRTLRARRRTLATTTAAPLPLSSELVRRVARSARSGDWEPVAENPGVGVYPDFVESPSAVAAALMTVIDEYGASHVQEETKAFFEKQMPPQTAPFDVNMTRATGRPELATQRECPWRYGDAFDSAWLPAPLRSLAARIQSRLALGALRDVTVNFRRSHFFRLDPHLDPPDDGPHVCICGLLSDSVLTLSPVGPPLSTIADQRSVSVESWAPGRDVDLLSSENSLIHLYGPARTTLHHGIRLGITDAQLNALGLLPKKAGPGGGGKDDASSSSSSSSSDSRGVVRLHDWFGAPAHLVPRNPARLSVVFAFADRDESSSSSSLGEE